MDLRTGNYSDGYYSKTVDGDMSSMAKHFDCHVEDVEERIGESGYVFSSSSVIVDFDNPEGKAWAERAPIMPTKSDRMETTQRSQCASGVIVNKRMPAHPLVCSVDRKWKVTKKVDVRFGK